VRIAAVVVMTDGTEWGSGGRRVVLLGMSAEIFSINLLTVQKIVNLNLEHDHR
jgi:hypothetical protein